MSLGDLLAIGLVVAAGLFALSKLLDLRLTVHEYERGLLFARGRLVCVLDAGAYWLIPLLESVRVVDVRSRSVSIPGQEVLSADNVSVKVSLALRYVVSSPAIAVRSAQSFQDALYLEAQLILRDIVSRLPIEELLEKRESIATQLRERLEPRAGALGLTLETIGIKDIMFPGGLKQIFAQVVEARKSAQAALEKARGETATLRHLANAARLLEGNPALVTLKTLQAASDGKHTLVLGLPHPVIPIVREGELPAGETRQVPGPQMPAADEPDKEP